METQYKQLSMEERCLISHLQREGTSIRKIAATLDRSASSISRELKRNTTPSSSYQPNYAQLASKSRRWTGYKLDRNAPLRETCLALLTQGLSPELISGRLALIHGQPVISYETIYRFIYTQIQKHKDYSWRHFLPQSKHKRGRRHTKAKSPANFMKHRVSIHDRPSEVTARIEPGHWEGDLMLFSKYGQAVLVAQERTSRLLSLFKHPNK